MRKKGRFLESVIFRCVGGFIRVIVGIISGVVRIFFGLGRVDEENLL